jgi:hypothetical protein
MESGRFCHKYLNLSALLHRKLAWGSMGEKISMRERIANSADDVCWAKSHHLKNIDNAIFLHSFLAKKHIYVNNIAFGINKCKFSTTLEATLMIKNTAGEINA